MLVMEETVARHYGRERLQETILAGIEALGRQPETVTETELGDVDEFHIGGREATSDITERLGLGPGCRVLDIGCGIGGAARFVAQRYGCRVTGVDLTPEFVATGQRLTALLGLSDRVRLEVANATRLPFPDRSFDRAILLHVGMNVAEKASLFAEAARVLDSGGILAVYDVMRTGDGDLDYPVPWASTPDLSFVARPHQYGEALAQAGFDVLGTRDHGAAAADFFRRMKERVAASGPPPLGLHILMGADAPRKVANMIANLQAGRIAPTEMICRRR